MLEVIPCQTCAGPTAFTTELLPLGNDPGHRVYYCDSCRRYTWITWRYAQEDRQEQQQQPSS